MGDFVLENIDKTKLTKLEATMISDNIKSHMGEWNTNPYSQVVLPKPKNKYQKMVHMCDLLASRKFINVNFNNNRIEE
jgi:FtsZ-interacting cell division protein YlmF